MGLVLFVYICHKDQPSMNIVQYFSPRGSIMGNRLSRFQVPHQIAREVCRPFAAANTGPTTFTHLPKWQGGDVFLFIYFFPELYGVFKKNIPSMHLHIHLISKKNPNIAKCAHTWIRWVYILFLVIGRTSETLIVSPCITRIIHIHEFFSNRATRSMLSLY